eukprot:gene11706-13142_t
MELRLPLRSLSRTNNLFIGMIPTTVEGLAMFHQPDQATMDISVNVALGGTLTPANPAGAIIPTNFVPNPALYQPAVVLPRVGNYIGGGAVADYQRA